MLDFISDEYKQKIMKMENELAFLHPDPERAKRWEKFFNPAIHENEAEAHAVDLMKDEVLDRFKVSEKDRRIRQYVTECLLDNMANKYVGATVGAGPLLEATATSNIASHVTWQLPLIRKIWPRLFLWELVPVYPMAQPQGKVFTLDFKYGSSGGAYASGTSIYKNEDPSYSDDPGEATEPKEIDMEITSTTVTAVSKKLKGLWSIESQQDLAAYHRLSMEPELMRIMGMQIEREINRTSINTLVSNASSNTNWASTQPSSPNAWANATPREYAESLWDAVEDANREIKNDVYVDANFILCGTQFASRLRKLNGFRLAFSNDALQTNVVTGPNLFGTLNNRYIVYEDPFFTTDKALIGHKGATWMYTGATYCPYIPVWTTPTIHNTKMQPARGYLTRYAFKVLNGDFYGTITVT